MRREFRKGGEEWHTPVLCCCLSCVVGRYVPWQEGMILEGSKGDQKIVNAPRFALSINQLGNHHGMIGRSSQGTGPKFGTGYRRGINDKGSILAIWYERGRRFQGANIRTL